MASDQPSVGNWPSEMFTLPFMPSWRYTEEQGLLSLIPISAPKSFGSLGLTHVSSALPSSGTVLFCPHPTWFSPETSLPKAWQHQESSSSRGHSRGWKGQDELGK